MKEVAEFLKHSQECRAMAAKASNGILRSDLEELARQWAKLASEREKFLKANPAK
jgi:hypothetical protein